MTQISTMPVLGALPASGYFVPVVQGGVAVNYSFDLGAWQAALAASGGSALVGFSDANSYAAGTVGAKIKSQQVNVDLTKYVKLNGSTWPYQDLIYDQVEHGLQTTGLVTNAGPANFFTPWWRASYLAAGHIGGLQTGMLIGQVRGAPDPSSTNLNYTPLQTLMSATANLGGTGLTLGTAKGAIFGGANLAVAYNGATNLLNLSGTEVNIQASTGSSVAIKTGTQIVQMPQDAVSGTLVDAGLAFSNQGGAVGWNIVLCLSHTQNGQHAVKTTGTLIGTLNSPSCAKGVDFSGVTFTGNAWTSPGSQIDKNGNVTGLTLTATSATPTVSAGQIALGTTTATTATAGTNGAPPAQVLGYLVLNLGGTVIKVPYYAA